MQRIVSGSTSHNELIVCFDYGCVYDMVIRHWDRHGKTSVFTVVIIEKSPKSNLYDLGRQLLAQTECENPHETHYLVFIRNK